MAARRTTSEEFVLRISPAPENQLCRDTLFESQARLLQVLHDEQGLRVPNVRWFEDDPQWFDRPFFVMDRARVAFRSVSRSTTPKVGSTTPRRRSVGRRGNRRSPSSSASTRCHPTSFASFPGARQGSRKSWTSIRAEYAWACDGDEHPIVDRLWEWLDSNVPTATPTGLSWGDARVGNIMFDDDFQVVVVMDWELVSLGTPIMDLGWWLFFDDVHSEVHPRLEGLGDRRETIERWEQGTGLSADGVEWYEILAAVRLTTLVIRAMNLQGIKGVDWIPFTRLAYDRLGWSEPPAV